MPRMKIEERRAKRQAKAFVKWNPLIIHAAHVKTIPGRNDFEDLRQEGLIQLSLMLQDYPNWDPVTSQDFEKLFKTRLWHRMVDLARSARAERRDVGKEVPLYRLNAEGEEEMYDVEDSSYRYKSADLQVVSRDLYSKVQNDLSDEQRAILGLLIHPPKKFIEFCGEGESTKPNLICDYLEMDRKEFDYHMQRIRMVTTNIQADYQQESIFSVVNMLALPPSRAKIPYWCVWECLDHACRRLFSLMIFSDIPMNVSVSRLSKVLGEPRSRVVEMMQKISATISQLYDEGMATIEPMTESTTCMAHPGCTKRANHMCFVSGVRGCDEHLGVCQYNRSHRFAPSMRLVHEEWCKTRTRSHSRNCEEPDCGVKAVTRCWETGARVCEAHLTHCRYNPKHTLIKSAKKTHEAYCKAHPEDHAKKKEK